MDTPTSYTITCSYCEQTWTITRKSLEEGTLPIHRSNTPPQHPIAYIVACPNCGKKQKILLSNPPDETI